MYTPSYSLLSGTGTSSTLKQYFSGEQGYAINADYAVIDVQPLAVSDNGTYTAPFSKAYSPVTVDVQEQPWEPLEDGYSNFWFELTNDTLSPWLKFSAKNNDAVIDWGDGSGEVALDTLTPTHTYAKAGKYVVKAKGVTGIAQQYVAPYVYNEVLQYVEFNSEVTSLATYAFSYATALKSAVGSAVTSIGNTAFNACSSLKSVSFPIVQGTSAYCYRYAYMLRNITVPTGATSIETFWVAYSPRITDIIIPATVTNIGNSAFAICNSLSTIHVQATTPPTLGTNVFQNIAPNYVIYVPVGTGETYKAAASGWSTYADHILEEGQTPNRAMLSRLAKAVETDTDEDMR